MVKGKVIATRDEIVVVGDPNGFKMVRVEWVCKMPDCTSTRKTSFAMMMHLKHDHEIQTQNLELRTGHFVLKTETATDAGPETQNGNT